MHVLMMLESEHENLRKLLEVAEAELVRVEDGLECDRELLGALAEYWRDYPDACHHPKEERILRELVKRRAPGAAALAERVDREHAALEALDERLERALASGGAGADADSLVETLRRFVDDNRRHITEEELHFFPAARRYLGEAQWEAIEFDVLDRPDPIFDRATAARYEMLRKAILALAERRAEREHARRLREHLYLGDAAWLRDVTSVERFNEVVGRGIGDGALALRAAPGGGFVLELGGTTVAEVPECDEARAAWCAYFFLLGAERGYPPSANGGTAVTAGGS